jgi:hypothetical protein
VIRLPTFQMTLSDVLMLDQVPPPSIDSVEEESSIPPVSQHSQSPDVAEVEEDVPPNVPSSDQHTADTSHDVDEVDTIQEATQEAPDSSDKRLSNPLRPPGGVELGIVHMPSHLQDKDPMWSANEMRLLQKSDYNTVISNLRTKPIKKSRFFIPLCRLKTYPKVRPIVDSDVKMLANEFVKGYREGDRVLYVSPFDITDKDLAVREDDAIWSNPLWKSANNEFEEYLSSDPDLHQFRNKYFYVYEGNHRVTAWMGYIHKYHSNNLDWYISVDCIVLDARGQCSMLLNAMNDINW